MSLLQKTIRRGHKGLAPCASQPASRRCGSSYIECRVSGTHEFRHEPEYERPTVSADTHTAGLTTKPNRSRLDG